MAMGLLIKTISSSVEIFGSSRRPGTVIFEDIVSVISPDLATSGLRRFFYVFKGCILAYLFRLSVPEIFLKDSLLGGVYMVLLPVVGATVGVKMVANIGNQKVAMKWCLLGASIGIPWLLQEEQSIITAPLFSAVLASKKAEWDPEKTYPKGVCNFIKRILILTLCGLIYLSLWTSVIYFNAHVTTKDGTQVPIHVAVDNFFQSPAWKEMKKTMSDLYEFCQYNGWGHCYQELIEHLDPTGESHAYKVLEFKTDNPSAEEIQQQCRKMARKWHPDKYRSEEEKAAAQDKFIEVQKACDILNDMRKKRTEKNMKSDTTTKVPPHEHQDL